MIETGTCMFNHPSLHLKVSHEKKQCEDGAKNVVVRLYLAGVRPNASTTYGSRLLPMSGPTA